jgi:hypothetical protein
MKSFRVVGGLSALGIGLLAANGAWGQSCDRACLKGLLDQYLAAVVKHDPSAAPLAGGFRETDNATVVAAGDGVWKSVTGLGKLQRRYIDPMTGAMGYYGTILEGGTGAIATVRLATDGRTITEAEWIIGRLDTGTPGSQGLGMTSIEGAEGTPPPDSALPRAKRVPRRVMVAAINAYFDSLQTPGYQAPFAPNYIRLENGMGTGEGPGGTAFGGRGVYQGRAAALASGTAVGGVTAAGAMATHDVCGGICNVAARRYPIVDEEAGVVLGMVVFQRPPANTNRRNLLSEWFTVDSGKITGIYAAMHYMNPTFPAPNWPPYDGNFPLSFDVGISPVPPPAPPPGALAPMPGPPPGARPTPAPPAAK